MNPSKTVVRLASVVTYLILGSDGFVAPGNLPGTVISGTHDASSRTEKSCRGSSPLVFSTHHSSRRHRRESSSLLVMAATGKKRKRRKGVKGGAGSTATASEPKQPAAGVAGAGASQLGDVLEGDRGVEALFTDDWSGMPANTGMVKSDVPLPDISEFKPSKRAETNLEQRQKKTAVGLVVGGGDDAVPASRLEGFKSKLTPIVDREEERRKKSAAERFDEGPIVKGLKTATWFSICALVLWEVYINSPWFTPPANPPPIL